jgi:methylated-DNA-[protein]-cysteine S-methyltransferase
MSKGNRGKQNGVDVLYTDIVRLPHGWGSVVISAGKIVSVEWEEMKEEMGRSLEEKYPGAGEASPDGTQAVKFLSDYSRGEMPSPRDISALDIAWDTIPAFQRKVLRETARIPYGRTVTYGELAARVGVPGAARAVGGALARNPWPIIVPCHRVLGRGGKLVGFGKGLAAKRALLNFEERNLRQAEVAQ